MPEDPCHVAVESYRAGQSHVADSRSEFGDSDVSLSVGPLDHVLSYLLHDPQQLGVPKRSASAQVRFPEAEAEACSGGASDT